MACTHEDLFRSQLEFARHLVEHAAARLLEAGEAGPARSTGWSRAEELGHLWDSAQVNHLRLLRGVEGADLVFPGYDQDAWVALQDPESLPWKRLVEGWRADNLRLLQLAGRIDPVVRTRPRHPHSLDRIGWQPFAATDPVSLEDLIRDYLGHLIHHLRRLGRDLVPDQEMPAGLGRPRLPIQTQRLSLRPLKEDDLDALAAMLADPEVVRFLPGPPRSREQSARTLAHFAAHQERHGFSAWAITDLSDGTFRGWCGLAEFDNTGEVELLYCLTRESWGQGLASEAAQACVACAAAEIGLPRLVAAVAPENSASRRVLEKCGFQPWRPARHFGMELDLYRLELDPAPGQAAGDAA